MLQRKLFKVGTTFQKQLNSIREVMALHYVKNMDMSANNIRICRGKFIFESLCNLF